MDKSKICTIFEYEFLCKTNASQTAHKINSMFRHGSTSYITVLFWFAKFRFEDFSLENELLAKSQPKVNSDGLKAIVESEILSQTTRKIASKFCVSIPSILVHLRKINKVKKLG